MELHVEFAGGGPCRHAPKGVEDEQPPRLVVVIGPETMEDDAQRPAETGMEVDQCIPVRPRRVIPARAALSPVDVGRLGGGDQVHIPARRAASAHPSLIVACDAGRLVVDRANSIAAGAARLSGDPLPEE
jgi:hypothetical protein